MKAERDALMALAYPQISTLCAQIGLQFGVVDMRWGVGEDEEETHGHSEMVDLCRREIAACQAHSIGPNFVTLLSQRWDVMIADTCSLKSKCEHHEH